MVTYLYGLVLARSGRRLPAKMAGIHGSTVRALKCGKLVAVVSTLDAPARPTLDNVRAHDGVLQAIVDGGTTAVAVRFGQSFRNDEEARRDVEQRAERPASTLKEYDGCVEMRLLLAQSPAPAKQAAATADAGLGPGRAYLEQIREAQDRHLHLALRGAIGPMVRAERVEELPKGGRGGGGEGDGGRGVAFAHLIDRTDEAAYREAVLDLPSLADATIVGPLALYSFTEPTT